MILVQAELVTLLEAVAPSSLPFFPTLLPLPPRIRFVSGTFVYRAQFRRATSEDLPHFSCCSWFYCGPFVRAPHFVVFCFVSFASWPDKYAPALKIQISRMCPGTGCSAGPAAGAGALAAPVRPGLPNAFHGGKGHVRRPQAGAGLRNGSSDGVSWSKSRRRDVFSTASGVG